MKAACRSSVCAVTIHRLLGVCLASLFLGAGSWAQEENSDPKPTFSLEAVAVNGISLPEPANQITAGPGTRITAKIFVRDWSPNGEKLRSYQAELEFASYESGTSGWIRPAGYDRHREANEENPSAAFIDKEEKSFIHRDKLIVPIVDTLNAPGYRWLCVLLDPADGVVSKQDGSRYYLGTVELEASEDADGEFNIGFVEDPHTTGLLDVDNQPIMPLKYEPLEVVVTKELAGLIIKASEPPSGAIDARMAFDPAAANVFDMNHAPGWKSIVITFNTDASEAKAEDFAVRDGTPQPPRVEKVETSGSQATVSLDKGIRPGRSTTIVYKPTNGMVRLAYLPGDVNNDGTVDTKDVTALVEVLSGKTKLPAYRTDLNRNGTTDADDLGALVELLNASWARNGMKLSGQ
jgi:hypothetical protein